LVLLLVVAATAQTGAPTLNGASGGKGENREQFGAISGVVKTDDGRPVAGVEIELTALRNANAGNPDQTTYSQPDGSFRFNNVSPDAYRVVLPFQELMRRTWDETPRRSAIYRPGAFVTFTQLRGSVVSGRVTDAAGMPQVAVPVSAIRVRDSQGRKLPAPGAGGSARTDDRGIYRIYGLRAGAYVVAAGPTVAHFGNYTGASDLSLGTPTYFPAASADTASEVNVGLVPEVTGIEIKMRPEAGHTISGMVTSAILPGPDEKPRDTLLLRRAADAMYIGETRRTFANGEFSLSGVPDGDYLLRASRDTSKGSAFSHWQRVRVAGANVSGLRLSLVAPASIAGRVQVELNPTTRGVSTCSAGSDLPPAYEFAVTVRRIANTDLDEFGGRPSATSVLPDKQGNFEVKGLEPGMYRLEFNYPDDRLYARAIIRSDPTGKPVEVGSAGIILAPGEDLGSLTATIIDGAATMTGKLVPRRKEARLAAQSLVHLVPAEPDAADDVLRYREAEVGRDGVFTVANLAPGKYWIYAEALAVSDTREDFRRPFAWDAAARLKLRRVAEAAKQSVELKPCQRITDQVVRVAVPGK
jgi:hypothetical protein